MYRINFLILGMFVLGLDAYIVSGILPNVSHSLNISISQTAQAVTVFTLCYALAAPILAASLNGKPARKVLSLALLVFSIANILSAFSTSLTMFLVTRAIAGLGAGLFSPIAVTVASTLVPPEKKGQALGLILGGMSAGTVLGVPVGLFINSLIGWRSVFIIIACIGFMGMVGVLLKIPNLSANSPPSLKQRLLVMSERKVAAIVGVSFLTAVSSLGLYTYMSPILNSMLGAINLTPYFWFWGIGGMIGSFTVGFLIDRTENPRHLSLIILSVLTLSLLSIPFTIHSGLIAFLPFILWGAMGWSSLAPQQHVLLSLKPEQGAIVVALNSSCNYLGASVGAMLGGILLAYGTLPSHLPYWAGLISIFALTAQILIVVTLSIKRKFEFSASS